MKTVKKCIHCQDELPDDRMPRVCDICLQAKPGPNTYTWKVRTPNTPERTIKAESLHMVGDTLAFKAGGQIVRAIRGWSEVTIEQEDDDEKI